MANIRPLALILAVSLSAAFASPQPNCGSALCGLVASGTLSSLRWPAARGVGFSVAQDMGFDVLREFWPEIAHRFKMPFRDLPEADSEKRTR